MELVVARYVVHPQRQQGHAGENIVQPGCVVADEEEGTLYLAEILLKIIMDAILGVNKQFPDQSQCIIDEVGMTDFSRMNGAFN